MEAVSAGIKRKQPPAPGESSSSVAAAAAAAAKAERIAMLKLRFADIIAKAQNKDPLLLQRPAEAEPAPAAQQQTTIKKKKKNSAHDHLLQDPHRDQQSNRSNRNPSSLSLPSLETNNGQKRQQQQQLRRCRIQKEREAARRATEAIRKTVEFNDNANVMQEFHKLIGLPPNPLYCLSNGYVPCFT